MGKGRAPCCDKSKVKKGPWSAAEDSLLTAFIHKHGHPNWRALPKLAGLLRCGKSCRLRWINYLRPDVKRGNFTPQEQLTIINLHNSLGNKWSKIASYLPGRTDNEIKNVWNTHLKKRLSNNIITAEPKHYYSPSPSTSTGDPRRPVQESDRKHTSTSDSPTSSDCTRPNKALEIPVINLAQDDGNFELDIDFWDLFGSLQDEDPPHSAKTDEINERDRSTKLEWLGLLEDELGLTSDDVDPLEQAVEMGPGFDYFPIWPSSPQFLGINSILGQ